MSYDRCPRCKSAITFVENKAVCFTCQTKITNSTSEGIKMSLFDNIKKFKDLVTEVHIEKYNQEQFRQVVSLIYTSIFEQPEKQNPKQLELPFDDSEGDN